MSRTLILTACLVAAALSQASPGMCTDKPAPGTSAAAGRGLALAERNCSQCHAIGSSGESPNAMAPPFRELHRRYPADSLEDAFGKGLLTHTAAMPKIRLTPAETADLTAYFKAMRERGENEASVLEPGPFRLARR